jgi:transposase
MPDNELFTIALNLEKPWYVKEVKFDPSGKRLDIYMGRTSELLPCPVCGKPCIDYDSMERQWRHLDFFQYEAYIHARIPRTNCREHGIKTVNVPWTRKDSGFTKLFEYHALDFCREMPVSSVSLFLHTGQDSVWRILKHYVDKARENMNLSGIENIGVDEIAIMKGHKYETIFYDHGERRVIHTELGKKNTVFRKLKKKLPEPGKVKTISMDMARWYILGVGKYFPKSQIVFDHFHLIKGMNDTVDGVRRREQKKNPLLKNTRFSWLKNTSSMTGKEKKRFKTIRHLDLQTAKAYHLRIALQRLWTIPKIMAGKYLERWITWAIRSGIREVVRYGKSIKRHSEGIIRAIMLDLSNSVAEGINNKIKTAFKRSYGFKSDEYRDTMIFLVAGKLDLPTLLQG